MDSSRRTGVRGTANDTGIETENGGKGGTEGLKEEAENSERKGLGMESLSTENLKGEARSEVEGLRTAGVMKATGADKD